MSLLLIFFKHGRSIENMVSTSIKNYMLRFRIRSKDRFRIKSGIPKEKN